MAIAQLIVSAIGLLWFILGSGVNSQNQVMQQYQVVQQAQNEWIYRGSDQQYHYYSDHSGNYWCRVNFITGEVSYKM